MAHQPKIARNRCGLPAPAVVDVFPKDFHGWHVALRPLAFQSCGVSNVVEMGTLIANMTAKAGGAENL